MPVMGVAKFERFFRAAAGLDVDKDDLKRYGDFVDRKVYDLLLVAQAAAKANGRDVVQPSDLPITKGLQESIHDFQGIDQEVELRPILDQLAARPPLDLSLGEEARPVSPPRGRTERGARPHLRDHRPQPEEPADRAVGARLLRLQPAAVAPGRRPRAG